MSTGSRLPWDEAYRLAGEVSRELVPHVVRVKAAGSLRRKRPEVGDLEFVAEPRMVTADLFGAVVADVNPIRKALEELGTWVKGAERMMQITDVLGRRGLNCEVNLVHPPAQWGSILAIRTGPYDLGRYAVTAMQKRGYRHERGHEGRNGDWDIEMSAPVPPEMVGRLVSLVWELLTARAMEVQA